MLDLNISGKTAIVTGGSSGIGLACAKSLFIEGVNVVIVGRKHLKKAVSEIEDIAENNSLRNKVAGVEADLTKLESIKSLVKTVINQFSKIDILVNCAGAALAGSFYELEDNDFIDPLMLKLLGYIRMVREVTPHMISQKDGRIVNIVGSAGRTPKSSLIPICTTNAALISFTRGISRELAAHNIRINAVSPGFTETERAALLLKKLAQAKGVSFEEVVAETMNNIPLGRLAKPAEIAALVLFLVSDLSSSITGTEILVDGGQTPCI
jgi:3-oxoacyl-[acyl-carrier protein] reductase/bacilysin biosynthesis oxidoreductase BacG